MLIGYTCKTVTVYFAWITICAICPSLSFQRLFIIFCAYFFCLTKKDRPHLSKGEGVVASVMLHHFTKKWWTLLLPIYKEIGGLIRKTRKLVNIPSNFLALKTGKMVQKSLETEQFQG